MCGPIVVFWLKSEKEYQTAKTKQKNKEKTNKIKKKLKKASKACFV
jgi:hypothetical protein